MKIGILTFHRADNYGALLQAYALQTILEDGGHTAQIIDYRCVPLEQDYVRLYRPYPPFRRNLLLWCREVCRRLKNRPFLQEKKSRCEDFRNAYLHMGQSLYTDTDRANAGKEYDLIFTGSDQVWSPVLTHGKDSWYAFNRREECCVVASYGASVGNLNRFISAYDEYRDDLRKYDHISVREKDLQLFLQEKLNKDISLVVDPTLLLESERWAAVCRQVQPIEQPYVLFYGVVPCKEAREIALELSRREHLLLVHFERDLKHTKNTYYAQAGGPIEFLSLVQNAKYVVTSSFHGTVFSVLFKKNFVAVPPNGVGSRLKTVMQELNLDNRFVDTYDSFDTSLLAGDIDFCGASEKLEELRKHALDYIERCIETAARE